MTETEAVNFIHNFGFDQILTDEDDPILWALAVQAYWAPKSGWNRVFAIGKRQRTPEEHKLGGTDKSALRVWFFDPSAEGGWRVHEVVRPPAGILPTPTARSRILQDLAAHYRLPLLQLQIERPSKGEQEVVVYVSERRGALNGFGAASIWRHAEGGLWIQCEETYGGWIA